MKFSSLTSLDKALILLSIGDIVDRRKYISYVTLRRMKEMFIDKCSEYNIDLHVIIGNHDVPYKNTNEINSMKELFRDGAVKSYDKPATVNFDGHDILIMPWINAENYKDAVQAMEETPARSYDVSSRSIWCVDG